METLRVRIEIGDREFEADGPTDIVEKHLNAFMRLTVGESAETLEGRSQSSRETVEPPAASDLELSRILGTDDRTVWLRTPAKSTSEALLVLLLGLARKQDLKLASGSKLIRGLRASGIEASRVDYFMNAHARRGSVTTDGRRRARRYRLTPAGTKRAEEIARRLIDMSPAPKKT